MVYCNSRGGVWFDWEPVRCLALSQINGGNCVSLPLNKGYGWAGQHKSEYIFEKLFGPAGAGYPKERAKSQVAMSRQTLSQYLKAFPQRFYRYS